jgi:hypothetical protein
MEFGQVRGKGKKTVGRVESSFLCDALEGSFMWHVGWWWELYILSRPGTLLKLAA